MIRLVFASFAIILFAATFASAAVKTKTISYKAGDADCKGFLAWDDAVSGPRPGVLVVHEWYGLNDYARSRAMQLAKLGYLAFACDMYGGGKVAEHPKEAGEMAGQVRANVDEWRKRAVAALDVLKSQPDCDQHKLAAIGYCFGGTTALQLAMTGADLKAVATFHAGLPAPTVEDAKKIKARLLICNGADDAFVTADAIQKFRDALDSAKVKYEFVNYRGAHHSFTVPNADKQGIDNMKYNKEADESSWKSLVKLLQETLGK
jgi:dienelactone hydrolase